MIKKLLFLVGLIFVFEYSHCQDWEYSNVMIGSSIEPNYSVIDNQGNLFLLATFSEIIYSTLEIESYGQNDLLLFKYNNEGQLLWYSQIGSAGNEIAGGLTLDDLNNVYLTGSYSNTCFFTEDDSLINSGGYDFFMAKYDSYGTFQWTKRVGSGSLAQIGLDLTLDQTDKLIVTGFFRDSLIIGSSLIEKDTLLGNNYFSHFVAKFDLEGNYIWAKRYLASNNLIRFSKIIASNNGYYIGGYYQGSVYFDIDTITSISPNYYDIFLYKIDIDGNAVVKYTYES